MESVTKGLVAVLALALLVSPLTAQDQAAVAEGAQVWGENCVRCHNARPSTERTDLQWLVIVNHMRARGNLTKREARSVTAFLQATNLAETTVPTQVAPASEPQAKEPRTLGGTEGIGEELDQPPRRY